MSVPSKADAPPATANRRARTSGYAVTDVYERGGAVERIAERLVEAERAYAILRDNGYGKPRMPLDEIAKHVWVRREL